MKVSVIIPAYNEQAVISKNMQRLRSDCEKYFEDFEIVVVNDGSCDRTAEIIRNELTTPCFIDAGYENNLGKGGALKAGVEAADGDIIITTDCDLAYGTEVIRIAAELFEKDPDTQLLIGSRSRAKDGFEGYPLARKLASRAYFKLISMLGGIKVSDSQCGFKAYSRDAAKKLFGELQTLGFAFDLEILMRASKKKMVIRELPVKIINHGESKISVVRDSVRMFKDVMKIRKMF